MRILIIDDDLSCYGFLNKMLSCYGECDIAKDGKEAIYIFKNALDYGDPFDLIFFNMILPHLDGLISIRKIRLIEKTRGIEKPYGVKIVMLSDITGSRSQLEMLNSGCDCYISKPLKKNKFFRDLQKCNCINVLEN